MQYPKPTLTLVLYIALILALSAHASPDVHRRDHALLKRIVKKRAPQAEQTVSGPLVPLVGAGASPTAQTTTAATTSPTTSPTTTAGTTTTTPGGLVDSLVQPLSSVIPSLSLDTPSSATTPTVSTTSSAAPSVLVSSSAPAPVTTSATPTTQAAVVPSTSVVKGGSTITTAVNAAESSASPTPVAQSASAKNKSQALTALIAVAASIGGIAIIWTLFRKWKLSRSSKVDSRMQPIDWQPTAADDGIPGVTRRMSGSSFRSGFSHSEHGHGYGSTSDNGHGRVGALPEHDFTAGSANLAPVGGYADLARGPSPQPQMESLNRGPSFTRPQYDAAVPLHHQAGGYDGRY